MQNKESAILTSILHLFRSFRNLLSVSNGCNDRDRLHVFAALQANFFIVYPSSSIRNGWRINSANNTFLELCSCILLTRKHGTHISQTGVSVYGHYHIAFLVVHYLGIFVAVLWMSQGHSAIGYLFRQYRFTAIRILLWRLTVSSLRSR